MMPQADWLMDRTDPSTDLITLPTEARKVIPVLN